jgi:hypothetical protein
MVHDVEAHSQSAAPARFLVRSSAPERSDFHMAIIRRQARFLALIVTATASFASAVRAAPPPSLPSAAVPETAPSLAQAQQTIAAAQQATNDEERASGLALARKQLEAYVEKPTSAEDLPTAQFLLGSVLSVEGRALAGQAVQSEPAEREKLMVEARTELQRAELAFSAAIEQLTTLGRNYPKFLPAGDPNYAAALRVKEATLQSLMAHAAAAKELATTFPPESEPAIEHYRAAAERYERIYKDYRTLNAGLMARLRQGECTFLIGDTRRALGLYDDILNQPADLEELRRLRVAAMYLSLECWTTEREKLYELAFSQGEEYLTHLRPEEESWPEWQAVRYHTARGYQLAAAALGADRAGDRAQYLEKAKGHAEKLAGVAGPFQELARTLVGAKP